MEVIVEASIALFVAASAGVAYERRLRARWHERDGRCNGRMRVAVLSARKNKQRGCFIVLVRTSKQRVFKQGTREGSWINSPMCSPQGSDERGRGEGEKEM